MTGIINNAGRVMRGTTRRDGWTAKRRAVFLGMLAATGSVGRSAAAAGMGPGSARELRARDAAFGESWEQALAAAYRRLEDELLAHALGRAVSVENSESGNSGGDTPEAEPGPGDLPAFDPALAIQVLRMRGRRSPGKRQGTDPLDPAAVDVALMRKLADLAERLEGE